MQNNMSVKMSSLNNSEKKLNMHGSRTTKSKKDRSVRGSRMDNSDPEEQEGDDEQDRLIFKEVSHLDSLTFLDPTRLD